MKKRKASARTTAAIRIATGSLLLFLVPQLAIPQQPPPPPQQQQQKPAAVDDDQEAQMDEALKKFGYVSGQAGACQTPGPGRTKHERQALDVATGVLRLFGSDRAFYYAAAYGAGVTAPSDRAKCPETIKEYERMLAKVKALAAR
ncbi:MAG: hypothetical protein KBA95_11765 [Acidobacteria bacterium]|nr:hypothetical protein [Acidobacteriota bacterium]